MAKVNIQTVTLSGYKATVDGALYLVLGTWDSYGIEKLKIVSKTGWENLTIAATFVTPNKSIRVLVPEDGVVSVPQEATAKPFLFGFNGKIVFSGVSDGVQRITTDLPFTVLNHAPVDGDTPSPTPSFVEQIVKEFQGRIDKAVPPDGTPGYVLGATENGNAWVPQTGGGGGSGGIITDDDTGTVYDAAVHIQDGYPVLILTERSADNG